MGNACVAGGGCPHKIDVVITNNTKYKLDLDQKQDCGRECKCKGFLVTSGKIVEGFEPPQIIKPYSQETFSASGREGSAVAPNGKVFYVNEEEDLKVMFEWNNAGWTSREAASADASVSGAKSRTLKSPQPWAELLEVRKNPDSWVYTLQKKEGTVNQALGAVKDIAESTKKFRII